MAEIARFEPRTFAGDCQQNRDAGVSAAPSRPPGAYRSPSWAKQQYTNSCDALENCTVELLEKWRQRWDSKPTKTCFAGRRLDRFLFQTRNKPFRLWRRESDSNRRMMVLKQSGRVGGMADAPDQIFRSRMILETP